MHETIAVLLFEDDPSISHFIQRQHQAEISVNLTTALSKSEFLSALQTPVYDCIILDYAMPEINGLEALLIARELAPSIPCIIFTGAVGEEGAVECMKAGAFEFILKSHPERLMTAIIAAQNHKKVLLQRQSAEQLARESENRYHMLTEISPVGIFRTDHLGKTTYVNPRWCTISGLEASKALGDGWLDVVHPEDLPSLTQGWNSAVHQSELSTSTYRFLRPDGKIAWVLGQAVPELNREGKLIGFVGTITDITSQKKHEEALRESEERFRLLVEGAPAAVVILSNAGVVRYANPMCLKLFGYSDAIDFKSKTLLEHLTPSSRSEMREHYLRYGEGLNISSDFEAKALRSDGTEFPIHVAVSHLILGGEVASLNFITDLTEQKKLQSQLLQSQKMDAIGQFAGGVAHDYNNMLGVILGYAGLLEQQLGDNHPATRQVKSIINAAERSANLSRQLLAFARKQIVMAVPLNINDELFSLQKILGRLIGEHIQLHIQCDPALWNVKLDPVQIDQVITNLCANARDAIRNNGTITIRTENITIDDTSQYNNPDRLPGEYALLIFTDTGHGMNAHTREHAFEPFFTTKPAGEGTGLGLATVFGIVKQNGGWIELFSQEGSGTTFKIYFPRHYGEIRSGNENPNAPCLQGTETVLLVEDEEELLTITGSILTSYGYSVFCALSPSRALAISQSHTNTIDLLITDVMMPEMNGKQLQDLLLQQRPNMKTMFISGYTADTIAQQGVSMETHYFLQKPFTPLLLAQHVRRILDT